MGAVPIGHTPTVLVVDDEAPTVELLTDALNRNGVRALSASDGRTGVELALAHHPDAIVLDLVMPGMTGFQVVRQLRDHPAARNIPILVFTGKELTAEDRARLLDGVQAVVRKDGVAELLTELARVCPAGAAPAAAPGRGSRPLDARVANPDRGGQRSESGAGDRGAAGPWP